MLDFKHKNMQKKNTKKKYKNYKIKQNFVFKPLQLKFDITDPNVLLCKNNTENI